MFIYSPGSGGSVRSNNTSSVMNLTNTGSFNSSMELAGIKLRSRLSSIGSGSAYTLPNINSGRESYDDDEEEQKDYVVFDEKLLKSRENTQKTSKTNKILTTQETIEFGTSKLIFDDENPIKSLIKKIPSLCCEVKHKKF